MSRISFRVKLFAVVLAVVGLASIPTDTGKAACNGQCGKVNKRSACIRAFDSSGDPIDMGTDCYFVGESCMNTTCG